MINDMAMDKQNKNYKSIIYMSLLAITLLMVLSATNIGRNLNFATITTILVIGLLLLNYIYLEKNNMGTKEIALIATLSAFAGAARVPFAGLPNIQPTTFLVALSGMVFGIYEGFLIGSTCAFISNIFIGQGPWTIWQMFAWGLVGAISGMLGKNKNMSCEKFAIICFFYGFMFDWIMNIWHVLGFIKPLNIKTVALSYLSGLTFDIMHGLSNYLFCLFFYESFLKVLLRFKRRLHVTRL